MAIQVSLERHQNDSEEKSKQEGEKRLLVTYIVPANREP